MLVYKYNFDSGVNFCGENFSSNFFLQELFLADFEKNRKIRTRKF